MNDEFYSAKRADLKQKELEALLSPGRKTATEQELRIMECLSYGFTRKETAHALGVADKTVDAHLHNLFRKLGCSTVAQATRILIERKELAKIDRTPMEAVINAVLMHKESIAQIIFDEIKEAA